MGRPVKIKQTDRISETLSKTPQSVEALNAGKGVVIVADESRGYGKCCIDSCFRQT